MPGPGPAMWRQSSCCGGDGQVTQIRIGNAIIGLVGLQEVLEQFHAGNREPGPPIGEALLDRIRARNYIARGDDEDYKAALLREYTAYRAARQDK